MAYNKEYYDERKVELEKDFNKKVAGGLQKIFQLVGEIQADLNDIQKKFQEIAAKEAEISKQNVDQKPAKK
jgi:uncharacterized protein YoxC